MILLFVKTVISFLLHFFTFLKEEHDLVAPQFKTFRFYLDFSLLIHHSTDVVVPHLYEILGWSSHQCLHCPIQVRTHVLNILGN